ncbi:hypothetical protein CPB85DRAFT_1257654 [Mucidula mucida]|nr:hypothetical protein CPB85DRAFT_1257654 [Mucidula mucida]
MRRRGQRDEDMRQPQQHCSNMSTTRKRSQHKDNNISSSKDTSRMHKRTSRMSKHISRMSEHKRAQKQNGHTSRMGTQVGWAHKQDKHTSKQGKHMSRTSTQAGRAYGQGQRDTTRRQTGTNINHCRRQQIAMITSSHSPGINDEHF